MLYSKFPFYLLTPGNSWNCAARGPDKLWCDSNWIFWPRSCLELVTKFLNKKCMSWGTRVTLSYRGLSVSTSNWRIGVFLFISLWIVLSVYFLQSFRNSITCHCKLSKWFLTFLFGEAKWCFWDILELHNL